MLDTLLIIGNFLSIICVILLARWLNSLHKEVYQLEFEVAKKDAALLMAAKWLKDYAVQHRLKGTAESHAKADVNESRAATLIKAAQYDHY